MMINIKDQIKLNYSFQDLLFNDDVEIDIYDIVEIIKKSIDEFNIENNYELHYDDIFLNIEFDDIINKFIKYKLNLLYKIYTYKNDELINISSLYDPLNNYNNDIDIKNIIYLINDNLDLFKNDLDEYIDNNELNLIEIEIINNNRFKIIYEIYDEIDDDNIICFKYYDRYDIINLFINNLDDIIDEIINNIDDELNKSYNKK